MESADDDNLGEQCQPSTLFYSQSSQIQQTSFQSEDSSQQQPPPTCTTNSTTDVTAAPTHLYVNVETDAVASPLIATTLPKGATLTATSDVGADNSISPTSVPTTTDTTNTPTSMVEHARTSSGNIVPELFSRDSLQQNESAWQSNHHVHSMYGQEREHQHHQQQQQKQRHLQQQQQHLQQQHSQQYQQHQQHHQQVMHHAHNHRYEQSYGQQQYMTTEQNQLAQEQSHSGSPSERFNPCNYTAAIKILVSNNVAGSIIGKAGQTISEFQGKSSTRIKLSQTGDYYPGTQDRVCLVQGEPENVKTALKLILERLFMLQEHQHTQQAEWQQRQKNAAVTRPAFNFLIRLLVPSTSCGMLIGKSGSNIKHMEETTGVCSVRLSPKDSIDTGYPSPSNVVATSERIVTVTGPILESCWRCLCLVVDAMLVNPDVCRYTNMTTSYTRVGSLVVNPSGARPMLMTIPSQRLSPVQLWGVNSVDQYDPAGPTPRRIASSPDLIAGIIPSHHPGLLTPERHVRSVIHSQGSFSSQGSIHTNYPAYMTPSTQILHRESMVRTIQMQKSDDNLGHHHGHANVLHSHSAPDLLAIQLERSMHISAQPLPYSPPQQAPHETFALQPPTLAGPDCFVAQVLVPDNMIGSILGRGGRALTELQMLTSTRIRVSQREEYMPGTRSRMVQIRGQTAQSVWQAQYMMNQRMILPPTAVTGVSYSVPPSMDQQQQRFGPASYGSIAIQQQQAIDPSYVVDPSYAQQTTTHSTDPNSESLTTPPPVESSAVS